MSAIRASLTILTLVFSFTTVSPVWAKKDLPAVNDEGMELVRNSELATVYADPGADLGIYNRIMLLDATVAFKKHWKRNQNLGNPLYVRDSDMVKIEEDVAEIFREVFIKELVDGGYEITDEVGEDVLLVKPAIVDLDIAAPDIPHATRSMNFAESAGEMTLNLELYDSLTNDKIVKATDRKRDRLDGRMEWRTSVSNRADAERMMRAWAKALRSTLDEARASTISTSD